MTCSCRPAAARARRAVETVEAREHYLRQNGKTVFKFAVSQMAECITVLLKRHQLTPDDIAMVIPHQANQRILDATAERLGLPRGAHGDGDRAATATRPRRRCRSPWTTWCAMGGSSGETW